MQWSSRMQQRLTLPLSSSEQELADQFNKFFTNKIDNIRTKPNTTNRETQYQLKL